MRERRNAKVRDRTRRLHRRIFDDDGPFSDLFDDKDYVEGCPTDSKEQD